MQGLFLVPAHNHRPVWGSTKVPQALLPDAWGFLPEQSASPHSLCSITSMNPCLSSCESLGSLQSRGVWGVGTLLWFHGSAVICWPSDTWQTHTGFQTTTLPLSLPWVWCSEVISAVKLWLFLYIWWKSLKLLYPLGYLPMDSWLLGQVLFLTCDFVNNFLLKPGWS